MAKINIGTSKGNLQNIKVDKLFNNINFSDIQSILEQRGIKKAAVYGWCKSPDKKKKKKK